jgi:quinohemoprotein ethanol dehydrogenase
MAHSQGRSDGIFCAYRATDGKRLWDFDAGTGIIAPPVTHLQDGVQYITLMVGWGGAAALANISGGGPIKRGYGRVLRWRQYGTGSSAVRTDRLKNQQSNSR